MFEKTKAFFRWLSGTSENAPSVPKNAIAFRISANDKVDSKHQVCTFDGTRLIDVSDRIPKLESLENVMFWSFPREDVSVSVTLPGASPEKKVEAIITVRFVPEMGLANFLENKTEIKEEELRDILQSQLHGLLDVFHSTSESLLTLEGIALENLRAKFSVLLSASGMRCTGLSSFVEKEIPKEEKVEDVPEKQEMESELQETVEKITQPQEWNHFTQTLLSAGMPTGPTTRQDLADLGTALLGRTISSQECVRSIREMAQASSPKYDTNASYWNGLAIRLRLTSPTGVGADAGAGIGAVSESENSSLPAVPAGKSSRPQRGWIFTNQVNLDQKLQSFLLLKFRSIRNELTHLRAKTSYIRLQTDLRLLEKELNLAEEMISVVPELKCSTRALRISSDSLPQILEGMNQAVTAAEYIEAALKTDEVLKNAELRSELKGSLDVLCDKIQKRSEIR